MKHNIFLSFAIIAVGVFAGTNASRPRYEDRSNLHHEESIDADHFAVIKDHLYMTESKGIVMLDFVSGRTLRKFPIRQLIPLGQVIIDDHLVYSEGGAYSTVVALDVNSGNLQWRLEQRSTELAHHRGMLFLNSQLNDSVTAVSAHSGKIIWSSKPLHRADHSFTSIFPTADGRIFTNSAILDENTGKIVRAWPRSRYVMAVSANENIVWIADTQNVLYAVDKKNVVVWAHKYTDFKIRQLVASDSFVGVAGTDLSEGNNLLVLLDSKTHKIIGKKSIAGSGGRLALGAMHNRCFVAEQAGSGTTVHAFNAVDGSLSWSYDSSVILADPVVYDGKLLLSRSNAVVVLDAEKGSKIAEYVRE